MKTFEATARSKSKVDTYISNFMKLHPFAAFLTVFVGGPLFTLLAVAAAVYLIALPLGFIMGWF
ncbi:hypothetical protein CAFE_08790 [Caprobacter fermentans]|uniref:Uncharacterized protein n=1 Tax=Caproicibacter fermentans TaxID=2576756 RepID=A0A6N8HWJ8_9FIRM|nr:hypothetical protein [Caproicibacter fermentans]MVB10201.1 hypothetical protein [Caproicibacter fermentans]OCN00975.1 hypothetical protein A7X67_18480 [Clostridium sp. W14A]QNK41789.1 hypothetical protein HCR03_05965 [Caproicibacter fermentans]